MTHAEALAIAALALFFGVSLWLGLTPSPPPPSGDPAAHPLPGPGLLRHMAFRRVPLLSPEDTGRLALVDAALRDRADGHHALPQTALAALLRPVPGSDPAQDGAAAAALAARRLDIAILDSDGNLAAAVFGHPPDRLTRQILHRAAIPVLTLDGVVTPDLLRARLDAALDRPAAHLPT